MKRFLTLLTLFAFSICFGQISKSDYLKENRKELNYSTSISTNDGIRIVGFGALHGSAETEQAELYLINSLLQTTNIRHYFPETDYSTAHFFQKYVYSGDDSLLYDLVDAYGERVPQEKSIEVFQKWQELSKTLRDRDIQVIGIDKIASFEFTVRHLMEILPRNNPNLDTLNSFMKSTKTNWSAYYDTELKQYLGRLSTSILQNNSNYSSFELQHIATNIQSTIHNKNREEVMYENYNHLANQYTLYTSTQFFRFGVYHIMKSEINSTSPFFHRLIKNNHFTDEEIVSVQGYLTKSEVLWDVQYYEGEFKSYSIKKGFGISDHWLERFKGIKQLKKNHFSDQTLFDLRGFNSPYSVAGDLDLIELKKPFGKSNWEPNKAKSTTNYIDFAILIRNSKASRPLELLKNE